MSLPSIYDYLPDQADTIMKLAAVEEKEEPVPLNKSTVMSAIKTTVPYVLGVGLGSGIGRGIGMGVDALERYRGAPLVSPDKVIKYGPMAFTALGGLLAAREFAHRKNEREIWRRAHESTQNRTPGSVSE